MYFNVLLFQVFYCSKDFVKNSEDFVRNSKDVVRGKVRGIVYFELLRPGQTVTADVYQQQLNNLNRALNEKRPILSIKIRQVLLLHDNARPHKAKIVQEKIKELKWKVLLHPAYSPDIAPSEYDLFRSLKNNLHEQQFTEFEEVEKWVADWIVPNPNNSFMTEFTSYQIDGGRLWQAKEIISIKF